MCVSPNQFTEKIQSLIKKHSAAMSRTAVEIKDSEALHLEMDTAMEELLIHLGYYDAVTLIRAQTRWAFPLIGTPAKEIVP